MLKKLTTVLVISFLILVLTSSTFAKLEFGEGNEQFSETKDALFENSFKTFQSDWSDWQSMNDGKRNGVDIRWKRGTFKYDGGDYQISWQLRNRYNAPVTLTYRLTFRKGDGSTKTTSEVTGIESGETASVGMWSIAYSLSTFQVNKIEFDD